MLSSYIRVWPGGDVKNWPGCFVRNAGQGMERAA